MRMKKTRFIVLGVLVGTLAACTTPRTPAPVVDRRPGGGATATSGPASEAPKAPEGRGYYTVKKGDTLFRIALEFGQSYRDIVAWNNLTNPNDIKVDQVLRVSPPDGVQTGAVVVGGASGSGIEVKPLGASTAANNGVAAPVAGAGSNKIGPRGDKRAYSDSTLAEMEKPDTAPTSVAAAAPATTG